MGVLTLAVFCLSACDRDLDVQQSYPFTVETMPVQKDIIKGQTAEIRCTLKRDGEFADTRYTIRYFQSDGKGLLRNDNGTVFKPNDRYPLTKDVFRLYYTSLSSDLTCLKHDFFACRSACPLIHLLSTLENLNLCTC